MTNLNFPNPFIFENGSKVQNPADWNKRAEEIKKKYQEEMYGYFRSGEKITYEISDKGAKIISFFGTFPAEDAKNLIISVEKDVAYPDGHIFTRSTKFSVSAFLPPKAEGTPTFPGGAPVIICMHDIQPRQYALEQGYAVIVINSGEIASDNTEHLGSFYDIYPYGSLAVEQTGVLAAWGWGASKVLDALYAGAAETLGINPDASIVTGVSRWGKSTAVCGLADPRFKMVVPSCSGAGGLALYRYMSEGNIYDFSSKEGSESYTYGKNEPLESLTSPAERGWFNDYFASLTDPEQISLEQYELVAATASPKRYYFIIGSCIGEDWVNAPSMWLCYKAAARIFDYLGLGGHLLCNIHREGHAVIEEDMKYLIAFFNKEVYGIDDGTDLRQLTTSVFMEEKNYDPIFDSIGEEWTE